MKNIDERKRLVLRRVKGKREIRAIIKRCRFCDWRGRELKQHMAEKHGRRGQ